MVYKTRQYLIILFFLSGTGVLGTDLYLAELSFMLGLKAPVVHFAVTTLYLAIVPFVFYRMHVRELSALKEVKQTKIEADAEIKKNLIEKMRLSVIADRIQSLVMITDNQGQILWVNSAFERLTGYTLQEAAGKYPSFLHGPNTDRNVQDRINRDILTSDFVRAEIINYTKSGEEYWVELNISAIYDNNDNVSQYISISNIITDRKQKEAIIEKQKSVFRQLAWSNSHAIRRPVASILSLAKLSEESTCTEELKEIHSLLKTSVDELDDELKKISREINQLESEIYGLSDDLKQSTPSTN